MYEDTRVVDLTSSSNLSASKKR